MTTSCLACGSVFPTPAKSNRKYCDWHCRDDYRQATAVQISCAGCGENFRPRTVGSRYCSQKCWVTTYNIEDRDHTMAGAIASGVVNGRRLYGTGTKSYRKRSGRHEHRVVAEEKIGRSLYPGEVVHHKDENHLNNDPNNLVVLKSAQAHGWIHDILRRNRA
jgi:hypothetical protein